MLKKAKLPKIESVYRNLPLIAQHVAVSVYGLYWRTLRFGTGFRSYLGEYKRRESFSQADWRELQSRELSRTLSACVRFVPYYRDCWTTSEKRAALRGDLATLPLLEKSSLRENSRAFLRSDVHPKIPLVFYTSGSTGTPIPSYYTVADLRRSVALREARSANWARVSFSMPRATFSGRMVEPLAESKGPYYRFNAAEQQVYFSAFHLRPDTAQNYTEAMIRHGIQWGTGYAFSFYLLARFIVEGNLVGPSLKGIVTTSEKLTYEMRELIQSTFKCRVYEEYSTVENAIFASECEYGRLHLSPDVSIVEILRPDGTACAPGEEGEVVVTTLSKEYQPLIRFRLGDLAMWDDRSCPCGRQMPVLREIVGRVEDVVKGPDGREMVRFHGIFTEQPNVIEGQIVQETLERIRVLVVPAEGFSASDVRDIEHRMHQRLGESVTVKVETVPTIPRTKAGKFKAVVSLLGKTHE